MKHSKFQNGVLKKYLIKKDEGENPHIVTNVFLRVGGMGLLSNSFCLSVFCRRNIH